MAGNDGSVHRVTLQAGQVRPEVWHRQKKLAQEALPPQFYEIVQSTRRPFVQAIWDVISPQNFFHEGKVILIGDALAGLRPHTGAGTEQAAFHSLILEKLLNGSASPGEFIWLTMEHSQYIQNIGVQIGEKIGLGARMEDNASRTDRLA
jgi:2-polyprenyl-6-methoxyphenol hydroxylase-like FAD-dependent oxidoreductase